MFVYHFPCQESIASISFSNKGSRYLCSGGSGQIVRIWDLQRKKCIKWLAGHSDTITGVMYNCRDEYLASISVRGDLILHNLTSGARTTEVKDPHRQVISNSCFILVLCCVGLVHMGCIMHHACMCLFLLLCLSQTACHTYVVY